MQTTAVLNIQCVLRAQIAQRIRERKAKSFVFASDKTMDASFESSALIIQISYRGFQARRELRRRHDEANSATKKEAARVAAEVLQRGWRCFIARRIVNVLKIGRSETATELEREEAALTITRFFRRCMWKSVKS